ncbi:MAG: class I SAM-dependent methyltransferase [Brevinematales bacterium]|nr:class I SAM-dependent methyltransferase [Brevinematales bacterium]
MKFRDSGMPDETMWKTFFRPDIILEQLEIDLTVGTFVDVGCGYGTFLFPASRIVKNAVGIDIDENMIAYCEAEVKNKKYGNIRLVTGDISDPLIPEQLAPYLGAADYITLFNLLHCEEPVRLLDSAYRFLRPGGKLGVIHWKYMKTPRGPALEIRPKPGQIVEWAAEAGFASIKQIDLPPYHYGIVFIKPKGENI